MMANGYKPIICVDFDGVIHSYSKGWQDGTIYDSMVPGFLEWAIKASASFQICIFSSRSLNPDKLKEMQTWLKRQIGSHFVHPEVSDAEIENIFNLFYFVSHKPAAFVTIDDRAITFKGDWEAPELQPYAISQFKPWNAKPD